MSPADVKTIIQCDFDSTIAAEDVSFMLLDAFADRSWRKFLKEYRAGRIPVGIFNSQSFTMVKADEPTMLDYILVQQNVPVRPGFAELLHTCARKGFEFVIVSNGLSFYIEAILKKIGLANIEVHAAETEFDPDGLKVRYIGPDGNEMQDGFKKTYTDLFLSRGYRVIYIGDGYSDIISATHAHHIFARDDLLAHCRKKKIDCVPFDDLNDVVRGLEQLPVA
jgi:2-hydroxy-3-keto-5-methylthiopentenyl-1-phosphate phosphatase